MIFFKAILPDPEKSVLRANDPGNEEHKSFKHEISIPAGKPLGTTAMENTEIEFKLPDNPEDIYIYNLSKILSKESKEVLVYAWVRTGWVYGNLSEVDFQYRIATVENGKYTGLFLLYGHSYSVQNAWSYNSQTFWLPVSEEKQIQARLESYYPIKGMKSGIKILAER